MTELIPTQERGHAQGQLNDLGHVGISGVYDTQLVELNGHLLYRPFPATHTGAPGEQVANITVCGLPAADELGVLLGCVDKQATDLRGPLFQKDSKTYVGCISMQPGTIGWEHTDKEGLTGLVAIATTEGSSLLRIEGGVEYLLTPGTVVFLDHLRQLRHQGLALGDKLRRGLAIAQYAPGRS